MHIGLFPMQSRLQARTVHFIVMDGFDELPVNPSTAVPWEIIADCVEKLVARPNLFLGFQSLQSINSFLQAVAIPRMSRLVSQRRLKYVLKNEGDTDETWSIVEPDGDNGWRVLGMF